MKELPKDSDILETDYFGRLCIDIYNKVIDLAYEGRHPVKVKVPYELKSVISRYVHPEILDTVGVNLARGIELIFSYNVKSIDDIKIITEEDLIKESLVEGFKMR